MLKSGKTKYVTVNPELGYAACQKKIWCYLVDLPLVFLLSQYLVNKFA